jgi:multimeric flavodoxin WrbA
MTPRRDLKAIICKIRIMKALILNGSLMDDSIINDMHEIVINELKKCGYDVDSLILRDITIAPCLGCFNCWVKTPGECITADFGRDIARKMVQNDLLIYFTPITFGGYSSVLKKALDRSIPIILPFFTKVNGEIHHVKRYDRYPSLIGVGILDAPNEEKENIFKILIYRNSINMRNPKHETIIFTKNQNIQEMQTGFNHLLTAMRAI